MIKKYSVWLTKNKNEVAFVIGILLISLLLRVHRFAEFPVGGETKDEYAWTFLGASLLQTGQPSSWSHFPQYQPFTVIKIGADDFPLVTPALDHPPLFSFLPGLLHALTSDWQTPPSLKVMRFPLVLLGVINVGLLYWAVKSWKFSRFIIYVSTILYATIPSFVFSSRLVVAENLLITWMLLALIVLAYVSKKLTHWQSLALIIVGAIAILTKMSGVVIPVGILMYGVSLRSKPLILAGALGGLLGFGLFGLYGAIYDAELFMAVFSAQSQRLLGIATLHNRFFLHPAIVNKIFLDGWMIVGLISFFLFAKDHSKAQPLIIFSIINLLFIATTVGETTFHGWYNFPLFPIFAVSIAWILQEIIQTKNYWLFWLLWVFLLPVIRLGVLYQTGEFPMGLVRILVGLGGLPLFLEWLRPKKSVKWLILSLGGALIIANLVTVARITAQSYWQDDEYFLPSRVVK